MSCGKDVLGSVTFSYAVSLCSSALKVSVDIFILVYLVLVSEEVIASQGKMNKTKLVLILQAAAIYRLRIVPPADESQAVSSFLV